MRVLIFGAGVIGSLYASLLSQSGCETAILARGRRLTELRNKGLLYRQGSDLKRANVMLLEELEQNDRYDYIFLTVRAEQFHHALHQLRENASPTIVTMVNSLEDYHVWEAICGKGRILPAFPGAGGSIKHGVLEAALTPRIIQSTTFAEIDGSLSQRVNVLQNLLKRAGIPCQIVPDMHAWQVCHLAMVVPLADAYYMTANPKLVHRDKAVMRKTAQALHDNFVQLKDRGDLVSPPKLNLFRLCPVWLITVILPLIYDSSFGDMFMYQHAIKAQAEMDQLHQAFYEYLSR